MDWHGDNRRDSALTLVTLRFDSRTALRSISGLGRQLQLLRPAPGLSAHRRRAMDKMQAQSLTSVRETGRAHSSQAMGSDDGG